MDSALRPRDIQARIRAGESPEDVAAAAGLPVERIAPFAAPVVAEREHVAGLARTHPVRRRGETTSHRTLRDAIAESLGLYSSDDDVEWDAWKVEDRRWRVRATWERAGTAHSALFTYDQMGRFSVADNDAARQLIGDPATDELALVRATQESPVQRRGGRRRGPSATPTAAQGATDADEDPRAGSGDSDDETDDSEDAFRDGDLQEVDGVYDIVPTSRGELDALYDMLSSFDEDSVKIYAGLVHPKEASTPSEAEPPVDAEHPIPEDAVAQEPAAEQPVAEQPVAEDAVAEDAVGEAADADEAPDPSRKQAPGEPEQLSLIGEGEPPAAPAPRRPRRKRASVPSWDEIMFGAPTPRTED